MRNLKKILALVLALMMTVSLMVVASAASYDDYSDKDEIDPKYAEAVEVLSGIGIFIGDEDGFRPTDDLSRAEVATLLYRVLSGDPADAEVDDFASYQVFDDVLPGAWPAGHVYYAYAAGWIKGNGDGTYAPDNGVLGCELAAMLVRALGRDKNGDELNGDGNEWAYKAVNLATELGITKGLGGVYLLTDTLTREQAAQMIFNALQVKMFTQVIGDYYQINRTLIGLDSKASSDEWGRPTKVWFTEDVPSGVATIEEEPVKTYYKAVTECDVATDVGIDSTKTYDTYTNGYLRANGATIVATDTKNTIGAQGTRTEVYKDRIVFIDTYLAQVTAVNEEKTDAAGHVISKANSELDIWMADTTSLNPLKDAEMDSTEYSVGSYILVNVNEAELDKGVITVYPVQEAESFLGAQTKIGQYADRHIVNGEEYYDAVHFYLGVDSTEIVNQIWFKDQFGNLIGVVPAPANTSYAVLKDLVWKVGNPGYAQATLVNMDGTEYTAIVNAMDGDAGTTFDWTNFDWDKDGYTPKLDDADSVGFVTTNDTANVSSDTKYNGLYDGYALYYVTVNGNGTVDLNGYNEIVYADKATMNVTASAIEYDTNVKVPVDDNTQFIVRTTNEKGEYVYTAYDRNNLPSFANETVDVFYNDLDRDTFADYVYIKRATPAKLDGTHLFVTGNEAWKTVSTGVWELTANLDGVDRTVYTNDAVKTTLTSNVGKLFHVDVDTDPDHKTYGRIVGVDLVNELTDYTEACNYLSGNDLAIRENGNVLYGDGVSYDVKDAMIVSTKKDVTDVSDLADAVKAGYGIWVLVDQTATTPYEHAAIVYVGEKLDNDDSATVVAYDANGDKLGTGVLNNTTFTITLGEDVATSEIDEIVVTASGDVNARLNVVPTDITYDCAFGSGDTTFLNTYPNVVVTARTSFSFNVYAENGVNYEKYNVVVEETNNILDDAVVAIRNGQDGTSLYQGHDAYFNFEDAVSAANIVSLDNDNHYVNAVLKLNTAVVQNSNLKVVRFTNSSIPTESEFNALRGTSVTVQGGTSGVIQIDDLEADTIVVVRMVSRDDNRFAYLAFTVDNNNP